MGTRLYVNTKNPLTLDMLADVPRGTYLKYDKIQTLPDSVWEKPEVRKRLMDAIAKDSDSCQWYSHELDYYQQQIEQQELAVEPTLEKALANETCMGEKTHIPWMMRSLWIRLVVSDDLRKMDCFMSEGFGRVQTDAAYLNRITGDENGYAAGGTKLFTQVAHILESQAGDNRLIFNREDWTIQSLTYTGAPYITWGRIDVSDTKLWRRGPRVKIAALEGVHWN